jgi:hypothetical protein
MNGFKKALGIGALALTLGGCSGFKPEYLEGTVIKESGSVVNIVQSSGALFGNESVKFGQQNYILTVETTSGKYIIDVNEGYNSRIPLAALAEAIEVGDKIKFKTNYESGWGSRGRLYFSRDRLGSIWIDDIEILNK